MSSILVWPNTVPFNAMLLTGKLPFKTRKKEPIRKHRGMVLFYNSGRKANGYNALVSGIDNPLRSHHSIIGEGILKTVRELDPAEAEDFARRCFYIYGAFPLGYFFENLLTYRQPIPTKWPQGVVQGAWIDADDFEPWRYKAMHSEQPITETLTVRGKF